MTERAQAHLRLLLRKRDVRRGGLGRVQAAEGGPLQAITKRVIEAVVVFLTARGLTTGGIAAHLRSAL